MAPGPKRNPRLLRAVEDMLLDFAPPSKIRAEMVRRFKCSPRTVTSYIAIADAERAIEESASAKHRRPRARATSAAAMSRCLSRAERLCDQAEDLLRKARKYEKLVHDALEEGTLEDLERPSPPSLKFGGDPDDGDDAKPEAASQRVLRAKFSMARTFRAGAMELLKRAEVAEQRADGWFSQYAKVSGIYEPEVIVMGVDSPLMLMTSAQRREKESALLAKLKVSLAKMRATAEAKDQPGAS